MILVICTSDITEYSSSFQTQQVKEVFNLLKNPLTSRILKNSKQFWEVTRRTTGSEFYWLPPKNENIDN